MKGITAFLVSVAAILTFTVPAHFAAASVYHQHHNVQKVAFVTPHIDMIPPDWID